MLCVALYEADRLAHEEAVVNGGVSFQIVTFPVSDGISAYLHFVFRAVDHVLVRSEHRRHLISCRMLSLLNNPQVRRARPRQRPQPRLMHLAIPSARHRRQLQTASHPGDAARGVFVRYLLSRTACPAEGERAEGGDG